MEKALLFLEKNELPPHWDRDSLFGHSVSSGNSDYDGELDSDVRFLVFCTLLFFFFDFLRYTIIMRNVVFLFFFLEFGRRTT